MLRSPQKAMDGDNQEQAELECGGAKPTGFLQVNGHLEAVELLAVQAARSIEDTMVSNLAEGDIIYVHCINTEDGGDKEHVCYLGQVLEVTGTGARVWMTDYRPYHTAKRALKAATAAAADDAADDGVAGSEALSAQEEAEDSAEEAPHFYYDVYNGHDVYVIKRAEDTRVRADAATPIEDKAELERQAAAYVEEQLPGEHQGLRRIMLCNTIVASRSTIEMPAGGWYDKFRLEATEEAKVNGAKGAGITKAIGHRGKNLRYIEAFQYHAAAAEEGEASGEKAAETIAEPCQKKLDEISKKLQVLAGEVENLRKAQAEGHESLRTEARDKEIAGRRATKAGKAGVGQTKQDGHCAVYAGQVCLNMHADPSAKFEDTPQDENTVMEGKHGVIDGAYKFLAALQENVTVEEGKDDELMDCAIREFINQTGFTPTELIENCATGKPLADPKENFTHFGTTELQMLTFGGGLQFAMIDVEAEVEQIDQRVHALSLTGDTVKTHVSYLLRQQGDGSVGHTTVATITEKDGRVRTVFKVGEESDQALQLILEMVEENRTPKKSLPEVGAMSREARQTYWKQRAQHSDFFNGTPHAPKPRLPPRSSPTGPNLRASAAQKKAEEYLHVVDEDEDEEEEGFHRVRSTKRPRQTTAPGSNELANAVVIHTDMSGKELAETIARGNAPASKIVRIIRQGKGRFGGNHLVLMTMEGDVGALQKVDFTKMDLKATNYRPGAKRARKSQAIQDGKAAPNAHFARMAGHGHQVCKFALSNKPCPHASSAKGCKFVCYSPQ